LFPHTFPASIAARIERGWRISAASTVGAGRTNARLGTDQRRCCVSDPLRTLRHARRPGFGCGGLSRVRFLLREGELPCLPAFVCEDGERRGGSGVDHFRRRRGGPRRDADRGAGGGGFRRPARYLLPGEDL